MSVKRHCLLTVQKKAEKTTHTHAHTHIHQSSNIFFLIGKVRIFYLSPVNCAMYTIEWCIESINRFAVFGCCNCCCQMIIKIKWLNDSIRINDVHLA